MAGHEILAGIFTAMRPEAVELTTGGTFIANRITRITVDIAPSPIGIMDTR
jgi:hypothetical protein